jgi:uncharacterized membrane protein YbhN (UPF0104 family)
MAWRWQVLLASKCIHEPFRWLTKLYYISYAASQVLPTGIGGDAVRILEHARRRLQAKGEAAGASSWSVWSDVSPLVYVILGPLLFLVTMIPVTVNGLGVRESFFVFFLGRFDVPPDAAFAAGFLFFAVTIAAALPGGVILALRSFEWATE